MLGVLVCVLVAAVTFAVTQDVWSRVLGTQEREEVSGGPVLVPPPNVYYLPYNAGEVFTDGFQTVELADGARGTLRSVELIGGEGLELLGVKVAGSARKYNAIQLSKGFPPKRAAFGPLREAAGAEIPAGTLGLELLVGLKVTSDEFTVREGLRVHYTVDGTDYVADFPSSIVICPPDQITMEECEERFVAEADGW